MKKYLLYFLLLTSFSLSTTVYAETMAGGWTPVQNSSEVNNVAQYAVNQQPGGLVWKLVRINSAERQVVAGINTKMVLTVANGADTSCAKAVVYTDLQQQNHLTAWDWVACH